MTTAEQTHPADTATANLTCAQVHLLRFLADQGQPPRSVRKSPYLLLEGRGLIVRDSNRSPYQLTDRGWRTLVELNDQDADRATL
jgi:hypothetical protein